MVGTWIRRVTLTGKVVMVVALACTAQPKLVLEKADINNGTVYNGSVIKTRVKFSNGGDSKLIINGVRTSCGCTTVREPKKELAPGESDFLEVQFNSAGFRGEVVKYINIESNDPTNQYATIKMTTEVKEELQPTNRFSLLWFGDIPVGKEMKQSYALRNISSSPITIKRVKKVYPKMKVTYDKRVIAPSDSVVITVAVTPNRIGYFNEAFTLETNSKNQPHVPLRVSYVGVRLK